MKIQHATIAEGLEDVSLLLGLNPEETVFIHSTNVPPDDGSKRLIGHASPLDHSQPLCYLPRKNLGATAKAIVLFNNKELMSYYNEVGLAPFSNYYNIDHIPNEFTITNLSVQHNLLKNMCANTEYILNDIKNKTIVSSYLSELDVEVAKATNGKLLMNPDKQIPFNSKNKMREFSQKYGFNVPLGIEINSAFTFDKKLEELGEIIKENNLDIQSVKLWCKLESQSSGSGTIALSGLTKIEIDRLKKHVVKYSDDCGLFEGIAGEKELATIKEFPCLVIEVDVADMPGNTILSNIGVEAVISDTGINLVGSVRQITNSGQYPGPAGRYLGSRIDEETITYQSYAEDAALPVLKYFWCEGYRGFVTIDVLVVQNGDSIIGYNIDPNARFSGGTMLLSIVQYATKMTGLPFYGLTYFVVVPKTESVFNSILQFAEPNLYLGSKSDFKGVIPFIINDFVGVTKCNAQIAVISNSKNEIEEMWNAFNEKRRIAVHNITSHP